MAKRYNEEQKISDVLKAFIQENKLENGINKVDAKEAWVKLMGNGVNNYTQNVELRNQVLYVSLSSSVLREELSMGKSKIVKMLNEELDQELIKKIVLK